MGLRCGDCSGHVMQNYSHFSLLFYEKEPVTWIDICIYNLQKLVVNTSKCDEQGRLEVTATGNVLQLHNPAYVARLLMCNALRVIILFMPCTVSHTSSKVILLRD